MKIERIQKQVVLTKKGIKRVQGGHPWVFEGEVIHIEEGIENGDIVDVFSEKGSYQGSGFYNAFSKIRVRLLSRNANDVFDEEFFRRRLQHAIAFRKAVMGDDISICRLLFGEADYFPGFTVDRFHDILVVQILSLGIEQRKDVLLPMLYTLLQEEGYDIKGIYERNDVAIRKLEGMEEYKGWYEHACMPTHPTSCITKVVEHGLTYHIDIENGQKTGFFLDQKYNRLAISKIAKGKTVLDCFAHTGSFGLHAAKGGANHVHCVDISQDAIDMAMAHAKLNALDANMSFEKKDVFQLLKELKSKPRIYDMIILDPQRLQKQEKRSRMRSKATKKLIWQQ